MKDSRCAAQVVDCNCDWCARNERTQPVCPQDGSGITSEQRLVWERRIGTIGVAYTEKYVAEVLDELAKANPLRFECPWCECIWMFHTQSQLSMIQEHMKKHAERWNDSRVQAALGAFSLLDRIEIKETK